MQQIADYRLIQSLGRGNHGEFFIAETPARLPVDTAQVAVKVLSGMNVDDALRRMGRELRAFSSVASPYLVQLHDAGQDGDRLFYSMEYYPLGSLQSPSRPVERPEKLRAMVHVSRAAHALHEAGVAHRGIKPGNVLLHEHGARLSDLGLAQALMPGQTVTGVGSIDSVEFLDPAIIRGEPASRASDIWSLGATLHWALAGVGIYGDLPAGQPLTAVRKVLTSDPEISATLTADERAVIERALAPDPANRPATAQELSEMIAGLGALDDD